MAYAPVQETLAPLVGGTPDEVERYRKLAEALMAQSQSGEPVEHWMEGVGRLAQALSGTLTERKANKIQREGEARGWEYLEGMGGTGGGYGGGEYADVPGSEAVSGNDAATMQYAGEAPSSGSAAIYQGMLKRGMNPAQAAAFAASVQQESGGNPNANNPGEGARGIIQWRADRLNNLQNFAARQGKPWNDVNTQMDFALWEMQNTEPGPGRMFRSAQTPEEANRALKAYIRYGDKAGPAGPAGWDSSKRLASTRRILGAMGGGETADIPGAEPVGSAPSPDVAQFLQPPAQPPPSTADRRAAIAQVLGGPQEAPADVAADVRKYYANEPPTTRTPYAEPMATAPSPDVMAHITGRQPTPAGISIQPTPTITGAPPPGGAGTVPLPPVAAAPVAAPVARVPQPRPAPPVAAAPVAPAVTGSVAPAAPVAPRPVYAPPVKNDYATVPGRRPSVAPVRPGQLMNEPYPGVMSAQEFARQGQAAMRAQRAGQQPAMAPVAGTAPQPRRNLLQALLGRGAPQGAAGPPAAPVAPAAPAGGTRERLQAAMSDIAFLPPAAQAMALKRLFPEPGERPADYTLDNTRFSGVTNEPIASVPGDPAKREIREDANGIPRYVDTQEPVFGSDTAGGGQAPVKITDVAAMRKEIQGLDSYKRYEKAAPVFNSLSESYGKNTRAGDLDFVYAMATIFDPESVVREGEQILVRNTANLPDQVVNGISSLMSGTGQLDGETRRNLYDVVHGRMKQYREAADNALAPFPAIAKRWSIDPADIMPTPLELKPLPEQEASGTETTETGAAPEGVTPEEWEAMSPEDRALWQ